MADEGSPERQNSLAPLLIFLIVVAFQFASSSLDQLKKSGFRRGKEVQLRREIKQLLKEASSLSQPSTFAQAAKLRRLAAAKEKELTKYIDVHSKEKELYMNVLFISKVITYAMLLIWFWRVPVASISQQLVQPFGKLLSWRTGGVQKDYVMVGIIPWLIVSTRVSKFICGLVSGR